MASARKPKPPPPYEVRELIDATWPCLQVERRGFSPIVLVPLPIFGPAREAILPARRQLAQEIADLLNHKDGSSSVGLVN